MANWVKCPACGQNNLAGDDDCVKCGAPLHPKEPAHSAEPQQLLPRDPRDSPSEPFGLPPETTPPVEPGLSVSELGSRKWVVIAGGVAGVLVGMVVEHLLVTNFQWAANWRAIRLFPHGSHRSRHWTVLDLVTVLPFTILGTYLGYRLARRLGR
jgi:hypothetical protein